jgi:hypothetical protein
MEREVESGGRRHWTSPAGISAIAAAGATLIGLAALIVQLNPVSSEASSPASEQLASPVAATATNSDQGDPGPSSTGGVAPVAGRVPAACLGCTPEEQSQRQASLDTIVTRLAAPRSEYCKDTTESFDGGPALARVGCSYPGSIDVDFALWANSTDLAEFTDVFREKQDARVQEWQLTGGDGPTTGMTVEFLENDQARMYWTYETYLISGNARYPEPDQGRLNDWWRTSGALLRESS